MNKLVMLNLGCCSKKLPGFINVDIRSEVQPDIVDNAFTLEKFDDESIDLIYCCHMLEHLSYDESCQALYVWYTKLKKGGILRLSVPDLKVVFSHYFYHNDLDFLMSFLYGGQKHEFDFHKNGWDFDKLTKELKSVGFYKIQRWDWQTTEPHNYCDDYSSCYYPNKSCVMQGGKITKMCGKLMSLNIEAIK